MIPTVLSDLHPNMKNPRTISPRTKGGLSYSMQEFGDLSGFVFNVRSGQLVSGHQRKDILPADSPITHFREMVDSTGTVGIGVVMGEGKSWHVRFVDWDMAKERAANLIANNPHLSGTFTDDVDEILRSIEEETPDIFDQAMLNSLHPEVSGARSALETTDDLTPQYDLSPMPYEHYNYVMLLFKNEIDWATACDHFHIQRLADRKNTKRIGLGKVIDGSAYLNQQLERR